MELPNEAELERLAILVEECAEVQQIAMKIIRHGYESYNPYDREHTSNRRLLTQELGDLSFAVELITRHDVRKDEVTSAAYDKEQRTQKYLHFNSVLPEPPKI